MNSPDYHEWEYLLDIDDSDLNLSAPPCLTNSSNFNDAPTQEMDHVDEKSSRIIPSLAGFFQTDRIHQLNNFNDAPTQEYIRKLYDDVSEGEDFKMLPWVKALEYINDNGQIGGGCFDDIKSYLKKGKLKKVVAIITSCKPNMLGDMNVTLKDHSGIISSIIHHKVLLNDDFAKAIKVGSAIILQNVYVFCPKSGEFYLNITIRNLVQIFQNVTVMEDANGASSSNISFQE
ncbi:transposase, MuDR, MULE transposase domain protein [Tanacetum coccineum]